MTEFQGLLRRAQKAQESAAGLAKAKPGSRLYEARQLLLQDVDQAVIEILADHLNMVELSLETRKGGRWQILHLTHGATVLKIPWPKLGENLQKKARRKMKKKINFNDPRWVKYFDEWSPSGTLVEWIVYDPSTKEVARWWLSGTEGVDAPLKYHEGVYEAYSPEWWGAMRSAGTQAWQNREGDKRSFAWAYGPEIESELISPDWKQWNFKRTFSMRVKYDHLLQTGVSKEAAIAQIEQAVHQVRNDWFVGKTIDEAIGHNQEFVWDGETYVCSLVYHGILLERDLGRKAIPFASAFRSGLLKAWAESINFAYAKVEILPFV